MKAILYISSPKISFRPEDIRELSIHASLKNQKLGITGYLYYDQGCFLQYIEGEEIAVDSLFATIQLDPRHDVGEYVSEEIPFRRFPAWSMRDLSDSASVNDTIEQTIIQTIQLFERNHIRMPESTKIGLFRFMDDLSRMQHLV